MKRTPMRRRARLRPKKQLRKSKPRQRTASMTASERQRAAVAGRRCIACGAETRIDPAHLIPRSLGGGAACACGRVPRADRRAATGQRSAGRRWRAQRDDRALSGERSRTRTGGSVKGMPTLVRDPQPAEFEALLERRRRLGQDLFDEVWEGVLHMNPAPSGGHAQVEAQLLAILRAPARAAGLTVTGQFNLGDDEHDYRVPDGGLHRDFIDRVFYPTAALVIEIVSPGDESWEKLPFYAAHGVQELLLVDPKARTVSWLGLEAGDYQHLKRSRLIELGADELARQIDWP